MKKLISVTGIIILLICSGILLKSYYKTSRLRSSNISASGAPQNKKPIITIQPTVSQKATMSLPSTTPTTQVSSEQVVIDSELIKQILNKEYYGEQPIKVYIDYDDGKYIDGNVVGKNAPSSSGALLAAKVNGRWVIIQAFAQQEPWCIQLTNYPDFPKSELPVCYDKNGQDVYR